MLLSYYWPLDCRVNYSVPNYKLCPSVGTYRLYYLRTLGSRLKPGTGLRMACSRRDGKVAVMRHTVSNISPPPQVLAALTHEDRQATLSRHARTLCRAPAVQPPIPAMTMTKRPAVPPPESDLKTVVESRNREWHFHIYFLLQSPVETAAALALRDAVLRLRRDGRLGPRGTPPSARLLTLLASTPRRRVRCRPVANGQQAPDGTAPGWIIRE